MTTSFLNNLKKPAQNSRDNLAHLLAHRENQRVARLLGRELFYSPAGGLHPVDIYALSLVTGMSGNDLTQITGNRQTSEIFLRTGGQFSTEMQARLPSNQSYYNVQAIIEIKNLVVIQRELYPLGVELLSRKNRYADPETLHLPSLQQFPDFKMIATLKKRSVFLSDHKKINFQSKLGTPGYPENQGVFLNNLVYCSDTHWPTVLSGSLSALIKTRAYNNLSWEVQEQIELFAADLAKNPRPQDLLSRMEFCLDNIHRHLPIRIFSDHISPGMFTEKGFQEYLFTVVKLNLRWHNWPDENSSQKIEKFPPDSRIRGILDKHRPRILQLLREEHLNRGNYSGMKIDFSPLFPNLAGGRRTIPELPGQDVMDSVIQETSGQLVSNYDPFVDTYAICRNSEWKKSFMLGFGDSPDS